MKKASFFPFNARSNDVLMLGVVKSAAVVVRSSKEKLHESFRRRRLLRSLHEKVSENYIVDLQILSNFDMAQN